MEYWHYRPRKSDLESILRWRRNVFVRLPDDEMALVCATRNVLGVHVGKMTGKAFIVRSRAYFNLVDYPELEGIFDGAWNVEILTDFVVHIYLADK